MRWGARVSRRHLLNHISVALVGIAGIGAEFSTHALADTIRFVPTVFLEQIFADNIRGSATDQDADAVTSVGVALNATIETSRLEAALSASAYYNEFWSTDEFDNANGDGVAGGRLTLLHQRLFIDGQASRQEVFLTPVSSSGAGLGTGGSQQQTSYSVGPLLTLNVFDLADFAARASYSQVLFDEPLTGPLLTPIDDITAKQVSARITTGPRSTLYEAIGTAEYYETDSDFRLRNVVGSLLLHLTQSFSAIGRYGYERISDPSFPTINGPRWAFGGRYTFSEGGAIRVEYGSRFGSVSWLGEADFLLSPRISLTAQYLDQILPAQLTNLRRLDDLFDDSGNLNLGSPPTRVTPAPALVNQTVRDKDLRMSASYRYGPSTYTLSGRHTERQIPATALTDKIYGFNLEWTETLSRSLTSMASIGYSDNYEPAIGSLPVQRYSAELTFAYTFNPSLRMTGEYIWALKTSPGEPENQENVLRVGVARSF